MDAASRTGIDDIREIIEGVRYAPAAARYKVYIIDEVHMLSKQAFNGLLKTLEEPPPHVKFIFATTEIRKVPVTVLSRCQRFDLRRIEAPKPGRPSGEHRGEGEGRRSSEGALALIARAAEGSVRDALSLLDQAIAHHAGEGDAHDHRRHGARHAGPGRPRPRAGSFRKADGRRDCADALADLSELYDAGADPLAVMQDLLETTHFLTRVKVAPGARRLLRRRFRRGQARRRLAGKLAVASLTRAWQMLLKGLLEVRDAANPLPAAEMALVRLAYAAELPPTDKLVRHLRDAESSPAQASPPASVPRGPAPGGRAQAQAQAAPRPSPEHFTAPQPTASLPAIELNRLEDIVALAKEKGARLLATQLENNVHLVSLERGRIEFRPSRGASGTLASDLGSALARLDRRTLDHHARLRRRRADDLRTAPGRRAGAQGRRLAGALRARRAGHFPGAEIVAVRERENDTPLPLSDEEFCVMDSNMMRQVQEMQRRAEELQKELAAMEVEGVSGGGLVGVLMNGLGDIKNVRIDPSLMKPGEHQIVEDLVVAASADAKKKLEARRLQDAGFLGNLLKSFAPPGSS